MPLTDTACRSAKPESTPRKLADMAGLYLYISPAGSKTWRVDYRHAGKRKTATLGRYPDVGLATARALRDDLKRSLAKGEDTTQPPVDTSPQHPFAQVANEWLEAQRKAWSEVHWERIAVRLRRDVYPVIGAMDIATIEAPDLLKVIRAVEDRGAQDIAARILQTTGAIFRYAVACGYCRRDPSADLRGALKPAPRRQHMAAVSIRDMPGFLVSLQNADFEPQTRLGLLLIIHTALRTRQVRFATWSEIDWQEKVWRLSGDRMKMGNDHVIPLSDQTCQILKQLQALSDGSDWIVPGYNGKACSKNRFLYLMYRLGKHSKATVHGFRSTFSTHCNESELWSADSIEKALAHMPKNAVRAAYYRGNRLDERRRLMQWWSDWITEAEKRGKSATDLTDLLSWSFTIYVKLSVYFQ